MYETKVERKRRIEREKKLLLEREITVEDLINHGEAWYDSRRQVYCFVFDVLARSGFPVQTYDEAIGELIRERVPAGWDDY